jgi:hypothetical protein
MARRKKKFKFISETQLEEYHEMSSEELTNHLIQKYKDLSSAKKRKKEDSYLKELNKEITEYKKTNTTQEIEEAREAYEDLVAQRDQKIADDIEELKETRAGFDDAIKAFKEHVDFLLGTLAQPDLFRDN